jgi:hypothetical protein
LRDGDNCDLYERGVRDGGAQDLAMRFMEAYLPHLACYANLEGARFFVMEKPHGRVGPGKETDGQVEHLVKDGIHFVCPDVVMVYAALHDVRRRAVDNDAVAAVLADFTDNSVSNCVDKAVVQSNNWFMVGSSKEGQPPYDVTAVLQVVEGKLVRLEPPSTERAHYVRLLSLRNKPVLLPEVTLMEPPPISGKQVQPAAGAASGSAVGPSAAAVAASGGGKTAATVPYRTLQSAVVWTNNRSTGKALQPVYRQSRCA